MLDIDHIEHFRRAMERSAPYSPAWYHFQRSCAVWVLRWRESNTLTLVKR